MQRVETATPRRLQPTTTASSRHGPDEFELLVTCGTIIEVECGTGNPFLAPHSRRAAKQIVRAPLSCADSQMGRSP